MKRTNRQQKSRGDCATCRAANPPRNGIGHPTEFCAWPGGKFDGDYGGAAKAKRISDQAAKQAKRTKRSPSELDLPDATATLLMANIEKNTEALSRRAALAKCTGNQCFFVRADLPASLATNGNWLLY